MPKISVIVPVYNVEKYLDRCLQSIIKQSLIDIEIIILNDGSIDNSENIIKKYIVKDKRIKYFCHENIGLGPTRNKGIEIATGEYLSFIDSDDFISENMLEVLYESAINNGSDIVCGQVCMYDDEGNATLRTDLSNVVSYSLRSQNQETFYKNYYYQKFYSHNAVDKIYRTALVKKFNIIFGDNKRIFSEDNYFQLQILNRANIISFVDKNIYFYYVRSNSIMNSYKKDLINRHMNMIEDLYINSNIENNLLQSRIINLITFEVIIMDILNILNSKSNFRNLYNDMKELSLKKIFIENIKKIRVNKSYELEPNSKKRLFIQIISFLIEKKMILIASLLIFLKYKYLR